MKTYKRVLLFFLCNGIGYFTVLVFYVLSLKHLVDLDAPDYNAAQFDFDLLTKQSLTWLICALFSFAIFFVSKKWRLFFYLAPIVIPILSGLFLLKNYM
jgi:hypothetical protein